ncbi:hypothetical protein [Streptomyces sp. LUP30]|uniref:hypothetical protein n=1 Tax=Streptomyces sp. LUP30 TaxID=1890285 RepID=UPI000851C9EF|nr:hypothetical protein [Streptomyces sp. LUP30]
MTTFTDDFNRANGSPGANWVQVSGTWSIISNQLSSGSAGGTIVLRAAGAMATDDNFAQVTIATTAAVSHGVWCRGNATLTQGYLWRNDGATWNLFWVVGGSFTSIGSFAGAAANGDVAKVQAVGSTIKGYVNGVVRVSVTDTAVTTGTSVGIRAESVSTLRFDDFSAGDVTAGATLGIASAAETAQPFTGAKAAALDTAGEAGTAQPLTSAKTATLGTATAAETTQALTGSKTTALGVAGAAESAQPFTGSKATALTPAGGQDTTQALTGGKSATLGTAGADETPQPLTAAKTAALGIAGSVESAQPLAGTKSASLAPAVEEDTAQLLDGGTPSVLGVASAVETAMPLVGMKTAVLSPAVESDTARPLAVPSVGVTAPSPERTYRVPAEHRQLTVGAEHRVAVVTESRILIVR